MRKPSSRKRTGKKSGANKQSTSFIEGGRLTPEGKLIFARAEAMKFATAKAILFAGSDKADLGEIRGWIVDLLLAEIARKWPRVTVDTDTKPSDVNISQGDLLGLMVWIVNKLGRDPDINPEDKIIPRPDAGDATKHHSKTISQIAAFLAKRIHDSL